MSRWNESDQFMLETMDMLAAPVLVYNLSTMPTIPPRVMSAVKMQRMMLAMQNKNEATDAEVVAYFSSASGVHPLTSEHTQVMEHCFKKSFPNDLDGTIGNNELSDYQMNYILNPLKRQLFKKRREIMKQRVKEFDKTKKTDFEEHVETPKLGQLDLFA